MDGVVDDRRGRGGRGEEWSEAEFEWRASDRNNDWRKRGVRAFSYLFHIRILLVSYSLHTRFTLASHPLPGRCLPASHPVHTRFPVASHSLVARDLFASYPLPTCSCSLPTRPPPGSYLSAARFLSCQCLRVSGMNNVVMLCCCDVLRLSCLPMARPQRTRGCLVCKTH